MKIKWNQLNRGIILAAVLAAGTAIYVTVQNVQFQNNIPELEQRAEQLGQEMAETNIGSGEATRRKQRAFVQNNFIDSDGAAVSLLEMGMSMTKSNMLYELNQPYTAEGEILSAEYKQINADVNKSGATGANVKIDYKVSYDCTGTPEFLGFTGTDSTEFYFDREQDRNARKTITISGSTTFYMLPDGGDWKIVSVTTDGWYNFDYEFADEEGGEPVE